MLLNQHYPQATFILKPWKDKIAMICISHTLKYSYATTKIAIRNYWNGLSALSALASCPLHAMLGIRTAASDSTRSRASEFACQLNGIVITVSLGSTIAVGTINTTVL